MINPQKMKDMIAYQTGAVVSKEIAKKSTGTLTLFAFDKGQELSEHSTPFDAFVILVEGTARITLSGVESEVQEGELLFMPALAPHALVAQEPFKMLLIMLKAEN